MIDSLQPTIAAYVRASNARDVDALLECFTPDAIVVDEGQTHCGAEEIRQWIVQLQAAFEYTLEVTRVAEQGTETIVTNRVSGAFPGSPIVLRSFFTLEGDKIAALTIRE